MAELALDIAGAYPEEAGVDTWLRTVILNRGADIAITESYSLKDVSGGITLNFLTPCEVLLQDDDCIALKASELSEDRMSGAALIHYDAEKLAASVEEVALEDGRLKHIWGNSLKRIMLKAKKPLQKDTLKLRITRG
jgi:hypothetical protein